jgi:hypothetical protein
MKGDLFQLSRRGILMARISFGLLLALFLIPDDSSPAKPKGPREALQPFNEIIGRWKGTGIPSGSQGDPQKAFWVEHQDWSWKFRGDDAWLQVDIADNKEYNKAELHYLPVKNTYQLLLHTLDKKTLTFEGKLEGKRLILQRDDPDKKEKQQLVIRLLHSNRFLYSYAVQPQGKALLRQMYQVGVTREGVPFAAGDGRPECIVSGGLGTIAVMYQGKTYYVCCSGCAAEFRENPVKYIKEYKEKKKKKASP